MTKLTKKLLLSIMTLVLVFMALGTTTFAWFSMNTSVTATGLQVQTKVGNNLFITNDITTSGNEKKYETTEANWKSSLKNYVSSANYLEPASTIDGKDFYYTVEAKIEGSKNENATWVKYNPTSNVDANFDTAYGMATGVHAVGYVDYAFQLKGINTGESSAYIALNKFNLVYNGDMTADEVVDSLKTFRAAIFYEMIDITDDEEATLEFSAASPVNATAVSGENAALYSNGNAFIKAQNASNWEDEEDALTAVASETETDEVALTQGFGGIAVAAGKTVVVKMVIRLWMEGEDVACKSSTFVDLTEGKWVADFQFGFSTSAPTTAKTEMDHEQIVLDEAEITVAEDSITIDGETLYELSDEEGAVMYFGKKLAIDKATLDSVDTDGNSDVNVYYIDGGQAIKVTDYCAFTLLDD